VSAVRSRRSATAVAVAGLAALLPGSAAAEWSTGAAIPAATGWSPLERSLDVAAAPGGAATAVWVESNGTLYVLRAVRIAADGSVGTVHPLATTAELPADVQAASAADGAATVLWQVDDGNGKGRVRAVQVGSSGSPGPVRDLAPEEANGTSARLAVTPAGAAIVVWQQTTGGGDPAIHHARLAPSGDVVASGELSDDGEGQGAVVPAVAAAADGSAVAVWESLGGPGSVGLQTRRLDPDGALAPIRDSVPDAGGELFPPALAAWSGGATQIVWQERDGDEVTVRTVRVDADGIAGAVGQLGTPHYAAAAAVLADHPRVVAGPDGSATAVWTRSELDGPYVVEAARIAPDGTPGAAQPLSPAVRSGLYPDAAIAPDGVVTVAWSGYDPVDGDSAIEARRIAADGMLGPVDSLAFNANQEAIPDVGSPVVATAADGAAVVGWLSPSEVRVARLLLDGGAPDGEPPPPPAQPRAGPPPPPADPPRARLALSVQPRRVALARGRRMRLTVTIGSVGGAAARGVRLCLRAPRRAFAQRRCIAVGSLRAGSRVRRRVEIAVKRDARRGGSHVVRLSAAAPGVTARTVAVRVRIR
jgi:hypothetical protein